MKRSSQVPASFVLALASGISASGCGSSYDCVDASGRTVADSVCRSGGYGAHYVNRNVSSGGFGGSGGSGGGFFGG